jgi:hypothetical protein
MTFAVRFFLVDPLEIGSVVNYLRAAAIHENANR